MAADDLAIEAEYADGQIRDLIKLRRTDILHWSQKQAGKAAGISTASWRAIEKGGSAPVETLARMLYALGATPEEVAHLDGGPAVARELKIRLELLPRAGSPPRFVTNAAEAQVWALPVSEQVRRYLILCLRVALQAEAESASKDIAPLM